MRLVVVCTSFDRSEQAIFSALPAAGIETEVVCSPDAGAKESLARAGVRVSPWPVRNRLDLRAVAHLRRLLDNAPADVIYAPRNSTLSVSLLATLGRRTRVVGYRGTCGHISRWDPAAWLAYLNPRVARIACVSNAVRDYLLGFRLPASRLVTIYKGHDPEWYAGTPPSLAPFGFTPQDFSVAFTGNMRPVKGVDVLIEAARLLPADSRIRLLLIGDVRDEGVRQLAASPGVRDRLVFTGFRKDAAALAGACNAYVMPSVEREGLPRGVIEAMCQGVCPVVSNVGGMPELVEDGVSGLVVPPRDPAALAAALLRLERDRPLCTSMGAAARARIGRDFHIRTTIDRMIALFRDAAADHPKSSGTNDSGR